MRELSRKKYEPDKTCEEIISCAESSIVMLHRLLTFVDSQIYLLPFGGRKTRNKRPKKNRK